MLSETGLCSAAQKSLMTSGWKQHDIFFFFFKYSQSFIYSEVSLENMFIINHLFTLSKCHTWLLYNLRTRCS